MTEGVTQAEKMTCGCGKPTRYMVSADPPTWACNKYGRCVAAEPAEPAEQKKEPADDKDMLNQ